MLYEWNVQKRRYCRIFIVLSILYYVQSFEELLLRIIIYSYRKYFCITRSELKNNVPFYFMQLLDRRWLFLRLHF